MQNVQPLSLVTTLVILRSNGESKSLGTGFFYQHSNGFIFLATNYHVITGISPSERGVKPFIGDSIDIQLRDKTGKLFKHTMPLFKDGSPLWLEHPTDKEADIILMPLPQELFVNTGVKVVSKTTTLPNVQINPSSPVVMIGYPHGYHDTTHYLPIWKTGSLASEPDIDFDGKKLIVVDISAFPGMSGSPAFYVTHSGYLTKEGNMIMDMGMKIHFLGVYASMQMLNSYLFLEQVVSAAEYKVSHSESLQLGHVWKAELLEEIAATSSPIATTPSQFQSNSKFLFKY